MRYMTSLIAFALREFTLHSANNVFVDFIQVKLPPDILKKNANYLKEFSCKKYSRTYWKSFHQLAAWLDSSSTFVAPQVEGNSGAEGAS